MFWGCKIAIGGLASPNANGLNKGNNFKTILACLVQWMNIILEIIIFITGNIKYCNGVTITIHKLVVTFLCYIWKACKIWCIRKIYIFGNRLISKPIIDL